MTTKQKEKGMDVREELISPSKAEQYLNRNTSNRKLRDGVVEKYSDDMKNKRWTTCPAPIVLYDNGDVADGQHRLWAIVEAGLPQRFLVMRGLDRAAGLNIDTGLSRTLVDNARISGLDDGLSNELLAVVRAIQFGERGTTRGLSNSKRLEFARVHKDAAVWAVSNGPRGRALRNAITLGAIGRAWYHLDDKERLRRFCDVLGTGHSEGQSESAAISMRNYLLSKSSSTSQTSLWRDTFLKTMNAINYFMRGKPLMVIKSVSEEIYPLIKRR